MGGDWPLIMTVVLAGGAAGLSCGILSLISRQEKRERDEHARKRQELEKKLSDSYHYLDLGSIPVTDGKGGSAYRIRPGSVIPYEELPFLSALADLTEHEDLERDKMRAAMEEK